MPKPSNSNSESCSNSNNAGVAFLQWALPKMDYRWDGFSKPRGQVLKRIRERMAELKLSGGYDEYKSYLDEHPEEWEKLDALCDITISKFFRDRKLWSFLRDSVFYKHLCNDSNKSFSTSEEFAIWSAGCCNGEEAYSLAIIYEQLMEAEEKCGQRPFTILASDRNKEVLQRAREGRYPNGALKELKKKEIASYFQEEENKREYDGEDESVIYKVKEQLRKNISFERRDIRESIPDRVFDMVLCRNLVFTYFSEKRQRYFLQRLKPHLKKSGFLVIGSNEQVPETEWLELASGTHSVFKRVV